MELRDLIARWGDNDGPSAVVEHGANPGLVSHFTKQALEDIARRVPRRTAPARTRDAIEAALRRRRVEPPRAAARRQGRSTSPSATRRSQRAEGRGRVRQHVVGGGLLRGGHRAGRDGLGHAREAAAARSRTRTTGAARATRSAWPSGLQDVGALVGAVRRDRRHGHPPRRGVHDLRAPDGGENGEAVYRPTVHYAYCPADAAMATCTSCRCATTSCSRAQRIMSDEIIDGQDELGVLLMGHPCTAWWTARCSTSRRRAGSCPIRTRPRCRSRRRCSAAVQWMIANPRRGVRVPDELPHEEILAAAKPYLGPIASQRSDWTPLLRWSIRSSASAGRGPRTRTSGSSRRSSCTGPRSGPSGRRTRRTGCAATSRLRASARGRRSTSEVDVLVIGAGLTGASAAYRLAGNGRRVAVRRRRRSGERGERAQRRQLRARAGELGRRLPRARRRACEVPRRPVGGDLARGRAAGVGGAEARRCATGGACASSSSRSDRVRLLPRGLALHRARRRASSAGSSRRRRSSSATARGSSCGPGAGARRVRLRHAPPLALPARRRQLPPVQLRVRPARARDRRGVELYTRLPVWLEARRPT